MEKRIEELEIKVAFLEQSLHDLDQVTQNLSRQNSILIDQIEELRNQLRSGVVIQTVDGDPLSEVPPHY